MSTFKIGDICIGQNLEFTPSLNGAECEIIGGLCMRPWFGVGSEVVGESLTYQVLWSDGDVTVQYPSELRLKRPPRSAKSIMREVIAKAKQPIKEIA